MSLQLSTTLRTNQAAAIATAIYAAGGTPTIAFYNGTEPTNCGTALSGNTLLASGNLASTNAAQFSSASGVLSLVANIVLTGQAAAGSGTAATFWRILDSAGTCQAQGNLGIPASGADIIVPSLSIANTETISITALSITMGCA